MTTGAEAVVGDINLNAVEKIKIDNLKTDNLQVNGRQILSLGGFDITFNSIKQEPYNLKRIHL